MAKGLFAKKSIKTLLDEASDTKGGGLKRHLGPWHLIMFGIGAIIGGGLFVLSGQAAAQYAGPGVALSFFFAAIICVFAALCYAEFASLIPVAGSAYSYAYVTMGEFIAWIIGCALTLEYLFSASTVSVGWSGYFVSLCNDVGITIPTAISSAPLLYDDALGWMKSGSIINLPAMLIVALLGTLVTVGIKAAASFNNILVYVKMGVILLFIICGIAFVNTDNLVPFVPENTGIFGQYGWSGVLRGAGVVFFAFIGFDALSTMSQEARNPQKDMPIGMLGSLGISAAVYFVVGLIMTGIVSYKFLNVPDPFAIVVNAMGPGFYWLRLVMKVAILAALTTVALVMLLGQSRIFFMMSKDGLLPPAFGKIHKKTQTPAFTTIVVSLVAMIVAGIFPVGILGQLVVMGALLAFAIVCFGVLVLRYTQPLLHRPFKTPFMPWVPLLGTLTCITQMILLPGVTWVQLIGALVIGCLFYFYYGKKHSKIHHKS